jgi:DNA-binding transcriptional LysR family regulator
LLAELARAHPDVSVALTVADTNRIVDLVADRALELGVVGFAHRHRSVTFEPLFRDEVVLACPPGHRFAGKTITLDELREETLILMQEGAGVREAIEDELRGAGLRLKDFAVRLELGLQESVRTAVEAGYGVTFISRSAIEAALAAGTLTEAHVEGLEPSREIFVARAAGRALTRVAQAFLDLAHERLK